MMPLVGHVCLWITLLADILTTTSPWEAQGTTFEVVFISNFNDGDLYITLLGMESTQVMLDGPFASLPYQTTIGTAGRVIFRLPSTTYSANTTVNNIQKKGISIKTNTLINAYILNYTPTSTDGSILLPVQPLQDDVVTHYMAVTYTSEGDTVMKFLVGVVAFYDQTTVRFTLKMDDTGVVIYIKTKYKNGDTFDVILDKHDVIQIVSDSDLTGTMVDSDKPISLFSGANCANIPADISACDHIMEQIPPIHDWGAQFVTSPLMGRSAGDVFRIVASQDKTSIQIDNNIVYLDQGEFYEWEIASNKSVFVSATQNILLVQYAKSYSADNIGDPAMLIVPAIEHFQMCYPLYLPYGFISFVSLVVPSSSVASMVVDQTFLSTRATELTTLQTEFNKTILDPFGETVATMTLNMTVLQIELRSGNHTIWSSNGTQFGLIGYGFGRDSNAVSYGFTAGGKRLFFGNKCNFQPCMNDAVCLNFLDTFVCVCKVGFFGSLCGEIENITISATDTLESVLNTLDIQTANSATFQTTDVLLSTETVSSSLSTTDATASYPLSTDYIARETSFLETDPSSSMPMSESIFPTSVQLPEQTFSESQLTVSGNPTIQPCSINDKTSIASDMSSPQTDLIDSSTSWVTSPDSSSAEATPQLPQSTVINTTETAEMETTLTPSQTATTLSSASVTISVIRKCFCTCVSKINKSDEEMKLIIEEIASNLTVNVSNLSSTVRKKISVYDDRPSAARVGVSGLAVITFVFGTLVLMDCTSLINTCLVLKKN